MTEEGGIASSVLRFEHDGPRVRGSLSPLRPRPRGRSLSPRVSAKPALPRCPLSRPVLWPGLAECPGAGKRSRPGANTADARLAIQAACAGKGAVPTQARGLHGLRRRPPRGLPGWRHSPGHGGAGRRRQMLANYLAIDLARRKLDAPIA